MVSKSWQMRCIVVEVPKVMPVESAVPRVFAAITRRMGMGVQ